MLLPLLLRVLLVLPMVVAPGRTVMLITVRSGARCLRFTYCCAPMTQVTAKGKAASSALKQWKLRPSSSSEVLRHSENLERIRSLEQQVRAMKGHLDVAKAKEKVAVDEEAFVLETVQNMNKDLESK
jgi:hypothetical protein